MTDNIEKRVEEFNRKIWKLIKGALEKEDISGWIEQALKETREETLREVVEIVERNRVELRDEKDHLPNTYQYLKGKNDLRDELLTHLKTLQGNSKEV